MVAVGLEVLRQRDGVRQRDTEMRFQIPNLRRVRATAGEQRRARGRANGLLAVGVVEDQPAGGETVAAHSQNVTTAFVPVTALVEVADITAALMQMLTRHGGALLRLKGIVRLAPDA